LLQGRWLAVEQDTCGFLVFAVCISDARDGSIEELVVVEVDLEEGRTLRDVACNECL
jgi:hypothetical protein